MRTAIVVREHNTESVDDSPAVELHPGQFSPWRARIRATGCPVHVRIGGVATTDDYLLFEDESEDFAVGSDQVVSVIAPSGQSGVARVARIALSAA